MTSPTASSRTSTNSSAPPPYRRPVAQGTNPSPPRTSLAIIEPGTPQDICSRITDWQSSDGLPHLLKLFMDLENNPFTGKNETLQKLSFQYLAYVNRLHKHRTPHLGRIDRSQLEPLSQILRTNPGAQYCLESIILETCPQELASNLEDFYSSCYNCRSQLAPNIMPPQFITYVIESTIPESASMYFALTDLLKRDEMSKEQADILSARCWDSLGKSLANSEQTPNETRYDQKLQWENKPYLIKLLFLANLAWYGRLDNKIAQEIIDALQITTQNIPETKYLPDNARMRLFKGLIHGHYYTDQTAEALLKVILDRDDLKQATRKFRPKNPGFENLSLACTFIQPANRKDLCSPKGELYKVFINTKIASIKFKRPQLLSTLMQIYCHIPDKHANNSKIHKQLKSLFKQNTGFTAKLIIPQYPLWLQTFARRGLFEHAELQKLVLEFVNTITQKCYGPTQSKHTSDMTPWLQTLVDVNLHTHPNFLDRIQYSIHRFNDNLLTFNVIKDIWQSNKAYLKSNPAFVSLIIMLNAIKLQKINPTQILEIDLEIPAIIDDILVNSHFVKDKIRELQSLIPKSM